MADPPTATRLAELVERARILAGKDRALLGVTGAPGAGKSTLAQALVEQVGEVARLVSMDGFHLARSRLLQLGRLADIGAIDTFDAAGFLALMRRLRRPAQEIVYAPEFRREIDEAVACAVPVEPEAKLVVVDGNYLLASQPPWHELRELLDEIWYVEVEEHTRVADLIARHRAYGNSVEEAHRMAHGPDRRNAELVASTRSLAHLIVRLDDR
jgi:pantothenate kinase